METAAIIDPEATRRTIGRPRRGEGRLGKKKISELVAQGIKSPAEIAEKTGVTPQAASQQLSQYIKDVTALDDYKKNRADILADTQRRVLSAMSDSDIKKASGKDKALMYGIFYDKERLERGESTSNMAGIIKVLRVADSVDQVP